MSEKPKLHVVSFSGGKDSTAMSDEEYITKVVKRKGVCKNECY